MTRTLRFVAILMVLLPPFAFAQTSPARAPRADQHRTESFRQKMLQISGISASPINLGNL